MSDETLIRGPGAGEPTATGDDGKLRPKINGLDSFKSAEGQSAVPSSRGSTPSGKKGRPPNKVGRPTKNIAGLSQEKIDEVADDPDIEAARAEFEEVLVGVLVAATEGLRDTKFETLKLKYPEAAARGLADKFLLTDKEKKYFGKAAVRLWRKYLGDKYLFSEEAVCGAYALAYLMRNFEGLRASGKINQEQNGSTTDPVKQSGLQGASSPDPRSPESGKKYVNGASDSHPPSRVSPGL